MSDAKQFHEWKDEQRRKDAPLVRDRFWYYAAYGRYCLKASYSNDQRQKDTPDE